MSDDKNPVVTSTIVGGVIVGTFWTVIASTLWQWVPIMAAITAVYCIDNFFKEEPKVDKPKEKTTKPKGKS